MNAALLLEHYERIAESTRLRRFVLDLAVRGKLVEQDPNDEAASKLVSTFQAERKIRIANREMRNSKQLSGIDEPPFAIPAGWLWLPLGETGNIFSGNSINEGTRERLSQAQSGRPFIATKDVGYGLDELAYANGLLVPEADTTFKVARPDTPLICSEGGSAGRKIGLCNREICFGNKLIANEPWSKISPRYVLYVYLSPFFYEEFRSRMTGVIGGISLNRFIELPFPLPPFGEQQRIVAKVDELMALCDQLEAAQMEREGQRDKLALSTLAKLNEPDPDTFAADARFTLEHLEPLTKRTDQIKQLRQTILNLAVRGKLVEQDPNVEPASVLLSRITAENQRLMREKGIRTQKPGLPVDSLKAPVQLPPSWQYVYLQDLAYQITDGTHLTPKYTETGKPFLSAQNIKPFRFMPQKHRLVSEADFENYRANRRPERGDILMTRVGAGIGEAAVLNSDFEFAFYVSLCLIKVPVGLVSAEYLTLWLNSPEGRESSTTRTYGKGASQGNLNLSLIRTFNIPLPPLSEQHRIIAKVDQLMALCDQLEASLVQGEQTRSKLLEAVLHEALEPA